MDLVTTYYRNITYVSGPLVFLEGGGRFGYGAMLDLVLPDGEVRTGQVLEASGELTLVQVLEGTSQIGPAGTEVAFREAAATVKLSPYLLGRVLSGSGRPRDGRPEVVYQERRQIHGAPLNPVARQQPRLFIETGLSAIDGFNTLIRGQKLPVFSGPGLPANEIIGFILEHAARRGRRRGTEPGRDFCGDGHYAPRGDGLLVSAPRQRSQPTADHVSEPCRRPGHRATGHPAVRLDRGRVFCLYARHARAGGPGRHDELLRGAARSLRGPRGNPGPPRLSGHDVHRSGVDLRAGRRRQRLARFDHPDPGGDHAGRRHHAPHRRLDGLHHRGPDRPQPDAAPKRRISARGCAAQLVAADEQRHRSRPHARGPPPIGQPVVCLLRQRDRRAAAGIDHRRRCVVRSRPPPPGVRRSLRTRIGAPGNGPAVDRRNTRQGLGNAADAAPGRTDEIRSDRNFWNGIKKAKENNPSHSSFSTFVLRRPGTHADPTHE